MNYKDLRKKFIRHVFRNWHPADEKVPKMGGVYVMIAYCPLYDEFKLCYVGSSKRLRLRLRKHEVLPKIKIKGWLSFVYYKPMKKGWYDYEMKLIDRLKPFFNIKHKFNA